MIVAGLSNPKYIAGQQLNRISVTVTERRHFLICVDVLEQQNGSATQQRADWWDCDTFVEAAINELVKEHPDYHRFDKYKVAKLIQAKAVSKLQSVGLLPAGLLVILKLMFFNLMKRLILNWILDQLTDTNDKTGTHYVQHVQSAPPEPQPDLAGSK